MPQYDTFLSYSHKDIERACRVKNHLSEAGFRVWMDDRILLGDQFRGSISDGLRQSRSITPILTQNALASEEVFNEVKFGVDTGMKIIPVVLSPGQLANSRRWRKMLAEIHWGRFWILRRKHET